MVLDQIEKIEQGNDTIRLIVLAISGGMTMGFEVSSSSSKSNVEI